MSIRIFESVCTYHRYQYGQTFTVIKIENTISSPRMLMQSKVSMHVESVVLLSHKKPDGHINVKVEFGEGEGKVPLNNIAKEPKYTSLKNE